MDGFSLSVIIPAYNEADRLPVTLTQLLPYLEKQGFEWEILVVDDGSSDMTAKIAQNFAKDEPRIRALGLKRNRGKGAALALGVASAEKQWLLLFDADGATPISELEKFSAVLTPQSRILIASRDIPGSERVVKQPWLRHKLGRIFILFRKWIVGLKDIEDTQCGFKLIHRDVAKPLFTGLKTPGFLFDVEVLGRARILGLPIQEIGVKWYDVPESKVKVSRELPRILMQLRRIRRSLKDFEKSLKPTPLSAENAK